MTIRMSVRQFTRLTNAFSKKPKNHCAMLSLYFLHYNFCRQHEGHRFRRRGRRDRDEVPRRRVDRQPDRRAGAEAAAPDLPEAPHRACAER